jgi:acetolactate synthase I/II/III large subunit
MKYQRNGAQTLMASVAAAGIEVCFANPGTTEMPMVLALEDAPSIRGILCLHENVATGAADGYARMTGKPAACLLHLGPGLANGLTNLHNARRAHTPIVNIIGEHATWHRAADPLLASDIVSVASMVSGHTVMNTDAAAISPEFARVYEAAFENGGQIASFILPHDLQLADASGPIALASIPAKPRVSDEAISRAAQALKSGKDAILLGGEGLSEEGLRRAGRITAKTGADLLCDSFFARMERGGDLPAPRKIPYFPDDAVKLTKDYDRMIIAGTRRPVAFFGYPGQPSHLTTEEQTVYLSGPEHDTLAALAALADEIGATQDIAPVRGALPDMPRGGLNMHTVSAVIARLQPDNCIIMDEALTVGIPYFEASRRAPRFSHLMLTGGAIGQGPGSATGAAIACPGRKVINYQSDGCGAYSVQAFWTQARENLDVVTIIGSNRSYNILKVELLRAGITKPGPKARAMADLDGPYLDWVRIGEGFGVPGVAVDTAEGLARELERALDAKGPRLIEAVMV